MLVEKGRGASFGWAGFAIKVPFWQWLDLQQRIRECRHWKRVTGEVGGFEVHLPLTPWKLQMRW